MSNLFDKISKVISILTSERTVTKTDRSTKGYDIKCNGTYIWFFTESPQDERLKFLDFDPKNGIRFFAGIQTVDGSYRDVWGDCLDPDSLSDAEKIELADWIRSNGHEWRCTDEDGELHGKGFYYGDDDESLFAPQELIQWNTGATTIEIRERKYELVEAEDGTVSLKKDGIEGWSYV